MSIKPKRAEYEIGKDAYGRTVMLIFERVYDGKEVWTIRREAGGQLDVSESVSGLTADNVRRLSEALS